MTGQVDMKIRRVRQSLPSGLLLRHKMVQKLHVWSSYSHCWPAALVIFQSHHIVSQTHKRQSDPAGRYSSFHPTVWASEQAVPACRSLSIRECPPAQAAHLCPSSSKTSGRNCSWKFGMYCRYHLCSSRIPMVVSRSMVGANSLPRSLTSRNILAAL